MPTPFSLDLRRRILDDVLAGMTYAQAGRKYAVSAEFVRQFHRRDQATGEIAPRPPIPRVTPFDRRHEAALRAAIAARPGLTLEQLRATLGLDVSIGTLWHALRALKITFKKRSTRPNNSARTSSSNASNSTSSASRASTRDASSSSTKPGSKPT